MNILGISCFYHDSAAALVMNGNIVSAAQEERFTRKKHDASFPKNAIITCLQLGKLKLSDIDYVVFYENPNTKFARLIDTYLSFAPKGLKSFLTAMPVWLTQKLFLKNEIKKNLAALSNLSSNQLPTILFYEHHKSHAASAFYPSPFAKAAVLCMDGVGEKATTSAWIGFDNQCENLWDINFPNSLGLLYSSFTYHAGFKVNSGEYKLMGLAPYGTPRYTQRILDNLIDLKEDGSFKINMHYFDFATGFTMTNKYFDQLFGARRIPESELTSFQMDMASSIQKVTEEIVLRLTNTVLQETQSRHLCLAGGVALNCVANGNLIKKSKLDDIWIQPAAGDAGGAIGAALGVWYEYLKNPRVLHIPDAMQGSYLGNAYSIEEIKSYLDSVGATYHLLSEEELTSTVANLLANEAVIGWFQGRMEFGPRALGNRSILGDPRNPKMQSIMNLKIKYRESFRPFAPAVKAELVNEWFELASQKSPYMLLVAPVKSDKRIQSSVDSKHLFGIDLLNLPRSEIPAVTHLDYSARIQTVHKETNPRFYTLIEAFEKETGCPVLINTSFNVRGEPIVCSPEDAYRCFMRTEMDYLILENIILKKTLQPALTSDSDWKNEFQLD